VLMAGLSLRLKQICPHLNRILSRLLPGHGMGARLPDA
jgi:hypothetical protein